jgi:hypothetical protein
MEAVRETTGGLFPAHIYLLDGNNLVSYIKSGETEPFRGRKFESVTPNPFKVKTKSNLITVKGSKGNEYTVDPEAKTCNCPGFTFRGTCKHLAEHG